MPGGSLKTYKLVAEAHVGVSYPISYSTTTLSVISLTNRSFLQVSKVIFGKIIRREPLVQLVVAEGLEIGLEQAPC